MAPEYENWHSAPKIVKEETLSLVNGDKKRLRSLLGSGFFLEFKKDITTLMAEGCMEEEEKENLIVRAKRSDILHHVMGFCKSSNYERKQEVLAAKFGDITLEDAKKRSGYNRHRCEIRGKHRSITKGKGFSAAYRRIRDKR